MDFSGPSASDNIMSDFKETAAEVTEPLPDDLNTDFEEAAADVTNEVDLSIENTIESGHGGETSFDNEITNEGYTDFFDDFEDANLEAKAEVTEPLPDDITADFKEAAAEVTEPLPDDITADFKESAAEVTKRSILTEESNRISDQGGSDQGGDASLDYGNSDDEFESVFKKEENEEIEETIIQNTTDSGQAGEISFEKEITNEGYTDFFNDLEVHNMEPATDLSDKSDYDTEIPVRPEENKPSKLKQNNYDL